MKDQSDHDDWLNDKYRAAKQPVESFGVVRAAWAKAMPDILSGETLDPYFLDWKFTPIEREAWNCIRRLGLPLFPQVPVAQFFLDFGDPIKKIGVELDGKDWHDKKRDTLRDAKLWALGWRIFRITGSESVKWLHPPTEPDFARNAEHDSEEYVTALRKFCFTTGDGVLWALQTTYYRPESATTPQQRAASYIALERHRLIDFELFDEEV